MIPTLLIKKFKFAANVWTIICLLIGFWGTMVLINGMAPQMRAASIKNENLTKIHTSELSTNINKQSVFTNYDGIKFIIKKTDKATAITVDTNNITIPANKIRSNILNKDKPIGYIVCEGLTKEDFNNKDALLKENFNNIRSIRLQTHFPKQGEQASGYFFGLDKQRMNNIYYNDINNFGILIADPNIYALKISVIYDISLTNVGLAQQTYNYLILK